MHSLIASIVDNDVAAEFLAWPGDFELDRKEHVEEVHLASGAALEGFAGDGSGGTYFFCGDGGEERPVLYADSEGGAALVAIGLAQLLQLLLVAPWWRDCQEFTAEESRELAAEYLEDLPDLAVKRDRVAATLGLDLPTEAEVLARLHSVATGAGKDFDLIFTPEGTRYDRLIED
ncbi:hypothetical protein [Actinoplanes regularis]|uniref:Uncharacterized protein n=1 Tax=Actinoplanes regularis TaxID=52697 RepID=A0A239ERY0_9ACTN|nr:hypothetical protein [Actinoplanes regularis]GIE89818.1 hypothetical protein Are01nite_62980 [Actinoplanes regularis]GLW31912.1 hypothetical protein Areg01_48510 [Actinoplanes regularis]SNS47329.1 hypothetical protein SAMN06264365_11677 [Actinoplanes regularis]